VSNTVTKHRVPGPTRLGRGAGKGFAVSSLLLVWLLASVFVHRFPRETEYRGGAELLVGADIPPSVADVLGHACANCHSETTRWPWYSYIAPVSWFVERDVKRAREHLNLSHWDRLDAAEQRVLLTAIATVIENREMPLHRYLMFHPDVKISVVDSVQVIEWTHAERRRLRAPVPGLTEK
jgi:Haem-binding domain